MMDWLWNNPIGTMYGPYFLLLYFFLCSAVIVWAIRQKSQLDDTGEMPPAKIPSEIDPYPVAFLRGGIPEVLRLATLDLFDRGLIESKSTSIFTPVKFQAVLPPPADTTNLPPIVDKVYRWFQEPRVPGALFQSDIVRLVEGDVQRWKDWAEQEKLVPDEAQRQSLSTVRWFSMVFVLGLGLYKLFCALATGHNNVGFLIFMMVMAMVVVAVCTQRKKLSARGRRYIDDLQTAFSSERSNRQAAVSEFSSGTTSGVPAGAFSPMMAMGIFGIAAISETEFAPFRSAYAASQSTGSGCGSTCGTASSCGGGSGCGGGGGGGGGCGGCGGGGD